MAMKITADRRTTAIGSLPHHNADSALDFSFRLGIPFLPQIPIRNPWEYMLAQALEPLPGIQVASDGAVSINLNIWNSRAHELKNRLAHAFDSNDPRAFEPFEPSPSSSSCWQPFLFELHEREIKLAKIQIAGPLTCQWAMLSSDGEPIEKTPELASQIYRVVLARSLAMIRRLKTNGVQPILYIDEPGLYALSVTNPHHLLRIQELKILIQALQNEGAWVGLHCCSNANWATVLSLDLNFLSIDAELSLKNLLLASKQAPRSLKDFLARGSVLSLGVIPTGRSSVLHSLKIEEIFSNIVYAWPTTDNSWEPELIRQTLLKAVYTPACGLALHSTGDAEMVLELLGEYERFSTQALSSPAGKY